MYSLAIYLKHFGHNVQGSDISLNNKQYNFLYDNNIIVHKGHKVKNIKNQNIDILVYSNAAENCAEIEYAKKNKIKILSRAELLGHIIANYKHSICVAGAHGKSTTTAMLYSIFKSAKFDPNLHLGAYNGDNKSFYITNSEYFISEACEYKDSFLNFYPETAVILNIEKEHLDYFKNEKNIKISFNRFANNSNFLIFNQKYENKLTESLKNVLNITFGTTKSDFIAKNIKQNKQGISFDCYIKENDGYKFYDKYQLKVFGKHNAINALACICVAMQYGIDKSIIKAGLQNFNGIKRRFEIYNKTIPIIHDYAHHPTEIKDSIQMAEKLYGKKLLIVFEPHTYSRTKLLLDDFVSVFKNKSVLILKTYAAREQYDYVGSAKYLAKTLKCKYSATYLVAKKQIEKYISKGYAILLLGAGTIDSLAEMLK